MIRVYNSLSRRLEELIPQEPGRIRMYNCGPTVYSSPHIGNFRSFLFADLLRRFLEWRGLEVTQIMNLTDVGHLTNDEEESGEDKMQSAARRERKTVWDIAEHYIAEFFDAAKYVHIRPAHEYPRATDHIAEMQEIITTLIDRGYAYAADSGNVYFEVSKFERYGELSGNRSDDLQAGARIEVNPEKRDPRDFALWKIEENHQMQWDAPWGRGFPGWHIECSAMARKFLGQPLDIHTGGEDNVFPHHECEIAQSECSADTAFVRYWMHARHLLVDGKKMAKRDGNFFTVADVRERGCSGDALRLALLRAHYREPLNFTLPTLDEASRKIDRYRDLQDRLRHAATTPGETSSTLAEEIDGHRSRFGEAMDDDLNVSVGLAEIDGLVATSNRADPKGADAEACLAALAELWSVFGLLEGDAEQDASVDADVEAMLEQRNAARASKDWTEADRLRDELKARGYEIVDTKDGARLKRV